MKNLLKYQSLETVGTILWLLTDFVWMNGFCRVASIMAIPTFLLLVSSVIRYDGIKRSELFALLASACWFMMNALWICSDVCFKDTYLLLARITFVIACVLVYISVREAKDENEPPDFKRLKLK